MSAPEAKSVAVERDDAFPVGIPYIVGNEGAERFSFYGMRAILKVYMAALYLHFVAVEVAGAAAATDTDARANVVTHLFIAGVYAFPMIGAILADRLLGKYPVILWLSLVYCAGHATLAVAGRLGAMESWGAAEYGMYLGLTLIAIGSGGIKPCVSANVGDQFGPKNGHLVTMVFQIFYFIINFGSFFSTLATPLLFKYFGAEVAFGVPGIMMGIATIVFFMGRRKFVHVSPKPGGLLGLLDFSGSVLMFSPIVAVILAIFVVGHDFEVPSNEGMSAGAFYWLYVSEYFGYLASHGWYYFLIAAVLVGCGFVLFSIRQKREYDTGFFGILFYAWNHRAERKPGMGFFDVAREKFGDDAAEGPPAVLRIMVVFSMVSVFWALFDQHASTWITQAGEMELDLTVPEQTGYAVLASVLALTIYGGVWLFRWVANARLPRTLTRVALALAVGWLVVAAIYDQVAGSSITIPLDKAQISALNPMMVMIIIPTLNFAVFRPLERRGITVHPLQKMTAGMFLAASAFAAAALLQTRVEGSVDGERVHVLWQVIQYFLMTTAEVLVSVTGLEFAYTQAPRTMKSTIMGFWLLCVTGGNVLVAFVAPIGTILQLSEFFWVFTGLMSTAAIVFMVLAFFYKGKTYLQQDA